VSRRTGRSFASACASQLEVGRRGDGEDGDDERDGGDGDEGRDPAAPLLLLLLGADGRLGAVDARQRNAAAGRRGGRRRRRGVVVLVVLVVLVTRNQRGPQALRTCVPLQVPPVKKGSGGTADAAGKRGWHRSSDSSLLLGAGLLGAGLVAQQQMQNQKQMQEMHDTAMVNAAKEEQLAKGCYVAHRWTMPCRTSAVGLGSVQTTAPAYYSAYPAQAAPAQAPPQYASSGAMHPAWAGR